MDSLLPIAIITVLIAANGLFVAAEFAIIGTPRASIERLAATGHRTARRIADILRDPRRQDQYIATAQLGITFASLGLGMYGEHVLAVWLAPLFASVNAWIPIPQGAASTITAVAILTYLHIVVGEMVPKTLALQRAEKTSLWITPVMLGVKAALYPLVIGLNGLGNAILRLFGVHRQLASSLAGHTAEELQYLIAESQQGGALRAEAGELLQDLLRFTDLTAGEVMVPRVNVVGIPIGATKEELASILRNSTFTRYPVYRNALDDVVGHVHVKDLLPKLLLGEPLLEQDIHPLPFLPYTADVDAVLKAMGRHRSDMAVVMDEYGGTAGIVTRKDLLDEVVGEMNEDGTAGGIHTNPQGHLIVAGTVRLEEISEFSDTTLEHEEVDTIGGLVLSILERPPAVGDTVSYQDVEIEVTAILGRQVKTCRVILKETAEDNSAADPESH